MYDFEARNDSNFESVSALEKSGRDMAKRCEVRPYAELRFSPFCGSLSTSKSACSADRALRSTRAGSGNSLAVNVESPP